MLPLVSFQLSEGGVGVLLLIGSCGVLEEVAVENVSYWLCIEPAVIKGASSSPLPPCSTGMLRFCTIQPILREGPKDCVLRIYTRCAPRTASGVHWNSGREAQKARPLPEEASLPCLRVSSFGTLFCWVAEG